LTVWQPLQIVTNVGGSAAPHVARGGAAVLLGSSGIAVLPAVPVPVMGGIEMTTVEPAAPEGAPV